MRRALTYVPCYLLWAISVALGLLDIFIARELLRRMSRGFLGWLSVPSITRVWVCAVVDDFGLLVLGLAWLGFAMASENYYRKGAGEHDLVRRFGRVMAAELSVPVLAYIVPFFIA